MSVLMAAHNYRVGHDKVYIVGVVPLPGGKFGVVARWGKNAGSLPSSNEKQYHECNTLAEAGSRVVSIINKKIGSGYVNIESAEYAPRGTRFTMVEARRQFGKKLADEFVAQPDDTVPTTKAAKPVAAQKDVPSQSKSGFHIPNDIEVLVVCVDPVGSCRDGMDVRDGFDKDDEYVAKASPLGDKFVQVFDRFGKPRSVPQEQFKFVAAVE